jgi:hypothetical protein
MQPTDVAVIPPLPEIPAGIQHVRISVIDVAAVRDQSAAIRYPFLGSLLRMHSLSYVLSPLPAQLTPAVNAHHCLNTCRRLFV